MVSVVANTAASALANTAPILPLQVDGLSFRAGSVEVLSDVSFRIEPGTRTMVLGPNGAGKSVLLRLLHGLLMPTAGKVIWSAGDAAHAQAMVFQRPVMMRRTVCENIEFALYLNSINGVNSARRSAALAALEQVGLAHLADRHARLCSGGEQQRVALARAWALKPQVLFLDEPTASLDPAATRAIEEAIAAMHRDGSTIIMTTHDLGQAKRLADRVLFLNHGCLLGDAPAQEFFQQPGSPEAVAFIKGELLW